MVIVGNVHYHDRTKNPPEIVPEGFMAIDPWTHMPNLPPCDLRKTISGCSSCGSTYTLCNDSRISISRCSSCKDQSLKVL